MKKLRLCVAVILVPPWFVATIGFCQFMFRPYRSGGCCPSYPSHWSCLTDWVRSGCVGSIDDFGNPGRWDRLVLTGVMAGLLTIPLAWSTRGLLPVRPNLRLRSLMVLIAILAFGYVGGREAWNVWRRWDGYFEAAKEYEIRVELDRTEPLQMQTWQEIQAIEDEELRRRVIEDDVRRRHAHQRLMEHYRRAMWRPWVDSPAPVEVDD